MVRNSFFGNKEIVQIRLSNPKAKIMLSSWEKKVARFLGPIIVRIFGWPLSVITRRTSRILFDMIPKDNMVLLDVGCSHGTYTFSMALEKQMQKVIGIDINQHSINDGLKILKVLDFPNVNFFKQDILKCDFPDEYFDIVIMGEVIEHIQDTDTLLKEIRRILRPRGILIISTPYCESSEENLHVPAMRRVGENQIDESLFKGYFHVRSGYSETDMIKLLEKHEFNIMKMSTLKVPNFLGRSHMALFPGSYPLSFFLSYSTPNKVKIIVKASKY